MSRSRLEITLRVLNAYTAHTRPAAADEAYLRNLTGDTTTPIDELACQIIQAELRKEAPGATGMNETRRSLP